MTPTTSEPKNKIILLLFVPLVNHFDFSSPVEKWQFFDLTETRKEWFSKKEESSTFSKEKWIELLKLDYAPKIEQTISQKTSPKIVIVNYPSSERDFESFQQVLVKQNRKVDHVILLSVLKYELILSLKKKYLICPLCEKITKREEAVHPSNSSEEKVFICPNDKEYRFSLTEIEKFNEWIIEHYLSNTKKVVEKFLSQKIIPLQLTVNQAEDIFSGKTQAEIVKIIESL